MSTAVDGSEFHLHFGVVAPEHLLDVNSVGHLGLVRCSAPAMRLRSAKYWPDSRDDRTFPRPMNRPNNLTSPPSNGFNGSIVPFMIMTEEVPCPAGLHLKFSGVGTFADTAATARNREEASTARRNAI